MFAEKKQLKKASSDSFQSVEEMLEPVALIHYFFTNRDRVLELRPFGIQAVAGHGAIIFFKLCQRDNSSFTKVDRGAKRVLPKGSCIKAYL